MPAHIFLTLLLNGVLLTSHFIAWKSRTLLTTEQKLALEKSPSKLPWVVISIVLPCGLWLWLSARLGSPPWWLGALMAVILLQVVGLLILAIRRLRSLDLPPKYVSRMTGMHTLVVVIAAIQFWSVYSAVQDDRDRSTKTLEESAIRTREAQQMRRPSNQR